MSVDLKTALVEVERALKAAEAEIGPIPDGHRTGQAYWDRRRAVMGRCADLLKETLGARIDDRWDGCSVKIAGVRSTCTAGMSGALKNWTVAAKRRLEA